MKCHMSEAGIQFETSVYEGVCELCYSVYSYSFVIMNVKSGHISAIVLVVR